jgi:hypothetical protein
LVAVVVVVFAAAHHVLLFTSEFFLVVQKFFLLPRCVLCNWITLCIVCVCMSEREDIFAFEIDGWR